MLPVGTFACSFEHNVALCRAVNPSAEATYQQLAVRLKAILPQMLRAGLNPPVQDITIGSTIGASMVIAVQGVMALLARVMMPPPSLQGLLQLQAAPAQLVALVGTHADEIVTYFDQTLAARPDAFRAAQEPPPPIGSPAQQAIGFFTKERIFALGTGVAVLGGLVWLARSSDKRLSGKVDRASFLYDRHEMAGSDDDADYEDEPEPEPVPSKVIDAESIEVESNPAA